MTAYFMQELILEPYAGLVFGFTPGQSTSLSGAQNGGVFLGMVTGGHRRHGAADRLLRLGDGGLHRLGRGACADRAAWARSGRARRWCPPSSLMGFFNGMFAVAAIGSMMALAGEGRGAREGTRMGLWGAAQAIAAGFGGLLGAARPMRCARRARPTTAPSAPSSFEALLYLASALMALRMMDRDPMLRAGPARCSGRMTMIYDVVVVGGGPVGRHRRRGSGAVRPPVALIDRAGGSSPAAAPSRPA
jgi:BCD family chlorophyll transporter-like MFS transporter